MPEPSVLGILGSIITILGALVVFGVRMIYVGKLVPGNRYAEQVARADRYEQIAMRALGVNEQMIPLMERQVGQAERVVQTVEDVTGYSINTESEK